MISPINNIEEQQALISKQLGDALDKEITNYLTKGFPVSSLSNSDVSYEDVLSISQILNRAAFEEQVVKFFKQTHNIKVNTDEILISLKEYYPEKFI
jgi:hypothetical protein